jgi:hypothetical protein
MKWKWGIVGLVLLAIAYVGYTIVYEDDLGITPATPLGTSRGLDRYFRKLGLQRSSLTKYSVPEVGSEVLSSSAYCEPGKPTALQGGESISLFVDNQGVVRAVLGGYKLSSGNHGTYVTPVSNFLARYWKQIGGGEPRFSQRTVGESAEYPGGQQQFATMSKGSVHAQWIKGASAGNLFLYIKEETVTGPPPSP